MQRAADFIESAESEEEIYEHANQLRVNDISQLYESGERSYDISSDPKIKFSDAVRELHEFLHED